MANTKTKAPKAGADDGKADKKPAVSRQQFTKHAKPLAVDIAGQKLVADVKEFSSGGFGWFIGAKVVIEIDGVPVKAQVTSNIVVVNSKNDKGDK